MGFRRTPARRETGDLQVRASDLGVRPDRLPDGTHLPLGGSWPRDRSWPQLPAKVRERIADLSGERIEWWALMPATVAADDPWASLHHRPNAVVIGTEGVVFAEPRITGDQRPVYSVTRHRLDPSSHRHTEVVFQPQPEKQKTDNRGDGETAARASAVPGLSASASELVSNLPPRAQSLLTAPFDAGHPVTVCDWYYEGHANRFPVFVVLLLGKRHLTMAHGSRVVPVGHTDRTSHWSLVCRRADLDRPERLSG